MSADHYFVLKYPDQCCAEVSRKGESQPCDKPAYAVTVGAADDYDDPGRWWPVCIYHARGRTLVPLSELIGLRR